MVWLYCMYCCKESLVYVEETKFILWFCQSYLITSPPRTKIVCYICRLKAFQQALLPSRQTMGIPIWRKKRRLSEDLKPQESSVSGDTAKNVVIVMDGFKDLSFEPLEWALQHIMTPGSTVTLLALMPWLNIPCKYLFIEYSELIDLFAYVSCLGMQCIQRLGELYGWLSSKTWLMRKRNLN